MLLDKNFAMKFGYYPTLVLDFQTASKIAKYSAHPHFKTDNEVITKETKTLYEDNCCWLIRGCNNYTEGW